MIWLGFSVLCSVVIANFLMLVGRKGKISMLPIFLGNYFVASIFSYLSLPKLIAPVPVFDLTFGLVTGALFLANFWVYQKCIVVNGLSLSVGVMLDRHDHPGDHLALCLSGESVTFEYGRYRFGAHGFCAQE